MKKLIFLCLLLASCNVDEPVTLSGTPVTNDTCIKAASSVHVVELGTVSIGQFLIARRKASCLSTTIQAPTPECVSTTAYLKASATVYAPAVLKVLEKARDELKLSCSNPPATTQERVDQALLQLTAAFSEMSSWAQTTGWSP